MRQGTTETNALWISQPGAIRTYGKSTGTASRIYKLYSAQEMVVSAAGLTDGSALNLESDVPPPGTLCRASMPISMSRRRMSLAT